MSSIPLLISGKTESERRFLAQSCGRLLLSDSDPGQQKAVEDLVRLLVKDASTEVRLALSESLKSNDALLPEVAEAIARDVEDVSLPFLAVSRALSEEILEDIISEASEAVLIAIASRPALSEGLCFAISEVGGAESISCVAENPGAEISGRFTRKVINRFPERRDILELIAGRSELVIEIIDLLIAKISMAAAEKLVIQHGLAFDYGEYLSDSARERAQLSVLKSVSDDEALAYLQRMRAEDGLSVTLVIEFLEQDQINLFESAMSVLTKTPPENARILIREGGRKGLEQLIEKAGIPKAFRSAMQKSCRRCLDRLPK